jgi:hypothetical protein
MRVWEGGGETLGFENKNQKQIQNMAGELLITLSMVLADHDRGFLLMLFCFAFGDSRV